MLSDFRFVVKSLGRARGFTLVTVLTLALGIGSAAAIFSVTDWILFRAQKLPGNVYVLGGQTDQFPFNPSRPPFLIEAYKTQKDAFSDIAVSSYQMGNVIVNDQPIATSWMGISANLLSVLEIAPVLGRGFLPGEDVEGANQVVILSYPIWKDKFRGDKEVLGRKITMGEAVCTIVGVLGEGQRLPGNLGGGLMLRPLTYRVDPAKPWMPYLQVLGRLQPGVTREQAQAALRAMTIDAPALFGDYYTKKDRPALASLDELNKWFRPEIYWLMLGAVGFLYAIACLNASNLMLVRMLGQRREMSVRLALGACRGRILRLLAAESVTLAVLASLVGLLVANWFFPLLLNATGSPQTAGRNWATWTLGWRVMGVMGLLTVLTSLVIAVIPALRLFRTDINSGLKDGGAALGESRALARLRGSLVVLQAAFAVILLAGAGLMIQTFANFQKVELGFDPNDKAKVLFAFPPTYPTEWEPRLNKLKEIQSDLLRVPGVEAVGFGTDVLLPGYSFSVYEFAGPEGKTIKTSTGTFNAGFQEASGMVLTRGRWITESRGEIVMVNESLARAMWPGKDPIGQIMMPIGGEKSGRKDWHGWTVVGVVKDIRATLREDPGYWIYCPEGWGPEGFSTFIVKFGGAFKNEYADLLRRRIYAFDPRIMVHNVSSISQNRDNQLWAERMANSVLQVLAGIALLLTVVGMFSVLAYTVDRRLPEFGVRMALGATRRDLVQLVMKRGLLLTITGVVLGLGGTLALSQFLKALLFGTAPNNPLILTAVGVTLILTSALACVLPARRAAKVDVSKLLRAE